MNIRLFSADICALEDEAVYRKALDALDDERRAKAERIQNSEGRKLSICAGLLMKSALREIGEEAGIMISESSEKISLTYRVNGKPYIDGRDDIFFNLSHSGKIAVCAVASCEVGCDIEKVRAGKDKIARRFFTGQEQRFAGESDLNFFRMWTLKESFLKVTGKGLALSLSDFSIDVSENGISVSQSVDAREYTFAEYPYFEGYCCSVCAADANAVFDKNVRKLDMEELLHK